jgi:hypothetical protein
MNLPNLPMLSPASAAAWPSMLMCIASTCVADAPAASWSIEPRTTCISSIWAMRALPAPPAIAMLPWLKRCCGPPLAISCASTWPSTCACERRPGGIARRLLRRGLGRDRIGARAGAGAGRRRVRARGGVGDHAQGRCLALGRSGGLRRSRGVDDVRGRAAVRRAEHRLGVAADLREGLRIGLLEALRLRRRVGGHPGEGLGDLGLDVDRRRPELVEYRAARGHRRLQRRDVAADGDEQVAADGGGARHVLVLLGRHRAAACSLPRAPRCTPRPRAEWRPRTGPPSTRRRPSLFRRGGASWLALSSSLEPPSLPPRLCARRSPRRAGTGSASTARRASRQRRLALRSRRSAPRSVRRRRPGSSCRLVGAGADQLRADDSELLERELADVAEANQREDRAASLALDRLQRRVRRPQPVRLARQGELVLAPLGFAFFPAIGLGAEVVGRRRADVRHVERPGDRARSCCGSSRSCRSRPCRRT